MFPCGRKAQCFLVDAKPNVFLWTQSPVLPCGRKAKCFLVDVKPNVSFLPLSVSSTPDKVGNTGLLPPCEPVWPSGKALGW